MDPPYNTGSDGFIYKDGYEESSWMSMMFDRLDYSNNLMKSSGKTSISIDDKEENVLTLMCKEMFNSTKKIAVKMSEASGVKMSSVKALGKIPKYKEYVVINSKEKILKGVNFKYIQKEEWDDEYNKFISGMTKEDYEEIKTLTSNDIIDDAELEKINKICSKWNIISVGEKLKEENILDSEKKTWLLENSYRIARTAASTSVKQIALNNRDYYPDHNIFCSLSSRDKIPYFIDASFNEESTSPRVQIIFAIDNLAQHPGDFWSDISTTGLEAEGSVVFKNGKKPLKLIDRLVDGTTNKDSIVLDFFAGSGTTAHVVIDLNREDQGNRKYILVEMGEYFDTVMLPRIQK
ncbi:DNA methyltransferase, partial [Gudongella sp. SC589]|uniref:DNA methyltransferase n=1 Tax=Gudongella sp. SC589 TaxID=3385990 RepID=UPI0039049479